MAKNFWDGEHTRPINRDSARASGYKEYKEPKRKKSNNNYDGCFEANTPVLMANGQQISISNLEVGMDVLTLNRFGIFEAMPITKVSRHQNIPMILINIGDCNITVTKKHLFMIGNKWKRAEKLEIGDMITAFKDINLKPIKKSVINISHNIIISDSYNIYVEKNSNYFVGGVLVSSFVIFNKIRSIIEYLKCNLKSYKGLTLFNPIKQTFQ
ncbi:MAG: hypothetical protein HQK76_19795 [Desulfobacterales bacterium]|nr:hypothetical protein [Desulfobacterales bacterium]